MSYPNPDDYVRAVQNPGVTFADPDLQNARFAVSPMLGVPIPASGTTAVVFRAEVRGEDQALRFFIREDASSRERYTALSRYVAAAGLSENMANARWADSGIRIGGQWYPLVRMQWVEGRTLDRYVEHLVDNADLRSLDSLAQAFRILVQRMQAARFAHGDLQHGNILVDERGVLRLVDFDCSWIGPFQGQPAPTESGHRNYQRRDASWGPWMDTFPALVIYLSIFALARNPRPWEALYQEENLLFQQSDFTDFGAAVWGQLAALRDPQVDTMVMRLQQCCQPSWQSSLGLEEVLGGGQQPVSKYRWVNQLTAGGVNQSVPPTRDGTPTTLPPPPPKTTHAPPRHTPPKPTLPPVRVGSSGTWWTPPPPQPPPPPPTPEKPRTAADVGMAIVVAFMISLFVATIAAATAQRSEAVATFWIAWIVVTIVGSPVVYLIRSRSR